MPTPSLITKQANWNRKQLSKGKTIWGTVGREALLQVVHTNGTLSIVRVQTYNHTLSQMHSEIYYLPAERLICISIWPSPRPAAFLLGDHVTFYTGMQAGGIMGVFFLATRSWLSLATDKVTHSKGMIQNTAPARAGDRGRGDVHCLKQEVKIK